MTLYFTWVVTYREKGMDNRVARMCRYRSILRGTGQEKCYGEEKKRDSTYINLLKGFSSGGEDLVFGNC